MNFRIASRQSQHRHRAGIDGMIRQINHTARTTMLPCQQVFHMTAAQASSREGSTMINVPSVDFSDHAPDA